MKKTVFILLAALLIHSCATLDVNEIENLKKESFEPFMLKPDVDVNRIRIDILRQKNDEVSTLDSTKETVDVIYHPFGFELGNDLFFDLNDNLGIRIDELFNVENKYFEVELFTRPKKNKGVYKQQFLNDTIKRKTPFTGKQRYELHEEKNGDTLKVLRKKRVLFSVIDQDTAFIYKRRWATKDVLYKADDQSYYLNRNRKRFTYKLSSDTLYFGKRYMLVRTKGNKAIELRWRRKRSSELLYRIERGNDRLFIYDRYFRGTQLEIKGDTLFEYHNNYLFSKYVITPK